MTKRHFVLKTTALFSLVLFTLRLLGLLHGLGNVVDVRHKSMKYCCMLFVFCHALVWVGQRKVIQLDYPLSNCYLGSKSPSSRMGIWLIRYYSIRVSTPDFLELPLVLHVNIRILGSESPKATAQFTFKCSVLRLISTKTQRYNYVCII